MPALKRNTALAQADAGAFAYPTGMVRCPMKMSGMAIMRCARLQRELGCGSRRELQALKTTAPERVAFYWPWLRTLGECPERATEREVRELLLAITPLKLAQRSRKNPRAYVCPACGGAKTFGARRCRSCWLSSAKRACARIP